LDASPSASIAGNSPLLPEISRLFESSTHNSDLARCLVFDSFLVALPAGPVVDKRDYCKRYNRNGYQDSSYHDMAIVRKVKPNT
jgi:hypothetical protein